MKTFLQSVAGLHLLILAPALGWASLATAQAQTCTGADPDGNAATQGLHAQYYSGYYNDDQTFFTSSANPAKLTRIDSAANFQTNASFGDLVGQGVTTTGTATNPDQFSVRYRGSFYAPVSTTYTFYLNSDDASALWLDNEALATSPSAKQALINNSNTHAATTRSASIYLRAGFHNLLLHYGEQAGNNVLTLRFSTSAISQRYVPRKLLCTSVQPAGSLQAVAYSPIQTTVLSGATGTSPAPTLTRRSGDTDPVYYELINPAAGVSIDANTGIITVAAGTATGNYTVSVRASTNASVTSINAFTFSVVENPNAVCRGTDEGGNQASNGLYAKYYAGYFNDAQSFFSSNRESISRIDPQLNYSTSSGWGTLTPPATGSDANPDTYSARYRGSLLINTAGTYTLSLRSDDASFLWLDNPARRATLLSSEAAINNGGVHSAKTVSVTRNLTAGKHDVVVHFGENSGDNTLVLEYSGPDTNNTSVAVPAAAFCSSTTGQPLPVELTRFEAQPTSEAVAVVWHTAQELHSAYFAIERSANGAVFEELARVAGAGNTTTAQHYRMLDRLPLSGLAYYRLRAVDTDGTAAYSAVVAVTMSPPAAVARLAAQVVPNPAAPTGPVRLRVQQGAAVPIHLTISSLEGRLLHQQELPAALTTETDLTLPVLRTSGVYLLRLTSAVGTTTQKLVVQ